MENNLLSNRQLLILLQLKEKDFITAKELAESLDISIRTIKNEISYLKNTLDRNKIVVESRSGNGYRIKIEDNEYYENITKNTQWNRINKIRDFTKNNFNRITLIIRELLLANGYIKIDELAGKFFISRSTVDKDMAEVRKLLSNFDISIKSMPTRGMKLFGSEYNLRLCISEYVFHQTVFESMAEDFNDKHLLIDINKILVDQSNQAEILLSDFSIKNISIHIYISLIRYKKGFQFDQGLFEEARKNMPPNVVKTAKAILKTISKEHQIVFSEEEILYLAVHLDRKQVVDTNQHVKLKDKKILEDILSEVKNNFDLDFTSDEMLINFLSQHIPQMVKRIEAGLVIRNPFIEENMRKYLFSLKITETAVSIIEKSYNIKIPLDEFGYLMLYFQTALSKIKKKRKIMIGFIMGRGRSESYVYLQELNSQLSKDTFEVVIFQNELDLLFNDKNIDIIVSMYPIEANHVNYNVAIEKGNYIESIMRYANMIEVEEINLDKYLNKSFFYSNLKGINKEEIYAQIVTILKKKEIIEKEITLGEPFVSQEIGNEIVHLQDLYKVCRKPLCFVGILENPIIWNKMSVKVIFMIKTKKDGDSDLPIICKMFSDFISDKDKVLSLKEECDFNQFKNDIIQGYYGEW